MEKKNIYLFYGSDNFSAAAKANRWRLEFEKKYGDLNSQVFEGEDFTAAKFSEAVATMPFLSDKKLIIIRDFLRDANEEEQKNVADQLEEMAKIPAGTGKQDPDSSPADYCIILFIETAKPDARTSLYKKIGKIGHSVEFAEPDKYKLIEWINQEFAKKNVKIKPTEAAILAETVGPNLWQMTQEVEKLSLFAASGMSAGEPNSTSTTITESVIESLVSPNPTVSIFKLTDYIAAKNVKASIKTLNTLLDSGENLMQTYSMIVRHFRIMIEIQSCLEKKLTSQQIIQKIKEHPFVISNISKQSRNFSPLTTAKIYKDLLQVDIDIKSGKIRMTTGDNTELRLTLEKLIIGLCM